MEQPQLLDVQPEITDISFSLFFKLQDLQNLNLSESNNEDNGLYSIQDIEALEGAIENVYWEDLCNSSIKNSIPKNGEAFRTLIDSLNF